MKQYILTILLVVITSVATITTQSLFASVSTKSSVDSVLTSYESPKNESDRISILNAMIVNMVEYSTEDVNQDDIKYVASHFEHCYKLMDYVGNGLTSKEKVNKSLLVSYITYRDLNCDK
jgi:hypothetical protein